MENKVSAVIVTYNRLDLLKEVIASVQNQNRPVNHIIVVDNASGQDTQRYLTSLGDQIDYVRLSENLGGAGGFNRGVRYFMEKTTDDYVWLMDDDTVPYPSTLSSFMAFAKHDTDFSFLASDVRWTDGHRAKMNQPAPMNRLQSVPENQEEPVQLQNATFVSLLLPRAIVKEIGLPITDFFIWGDDIEYTERAGRLAPGYLVPAARVVHKMASNVGSSIINDDAVRLPRYFYSYRNKMYYARKRDWYRKNRARLRMLLEYLQLWITRVPDRKARLDVFERGIRAGRSFNPEIEYAHDLRDQ